LTIVKRIFDALGFTPVNIFCEFNISIFGYWILLFILLLIIQKKKSPSWNDFRSYRRRIRCSAVRISRIIISWQEEIIWSHPQSHRYRISIQSRSWNWTHPYHIWCNRRRQSISKWVTFLILKLNFSAELYSQKFLISKILDAITYGGANVIIPDLTNVQGVIHIIDAVILTDSQLPSINKKY
jgi:hypothetical protein